MPTTSSLLSTFTSYQVEQTRKGARREMRRMARIGIDISYAEAFEGEVRWMARLLDKE